MSYVKIIEVDNPIEVAGEGEFGHIGLKGYRPNSERVIVDVVDFEENEEGEMEVVVKAINYFYNKEDVIGNLDEGDVIALGI